ncbi:MAG: hypothetical protein RLZZ283_302 [Candidatus Parcubacteria bacterium]|jgi:hypothetical protein
MSIVQEGLSPFEFTQHVGKRVFVRTIDGKTETGVLRLAPRAIEVLPKSGSVFFCVPYNEVSEICPVGDKKKK